MPAKHPPARARNQRPDVISQRIEDWLLAEQTTQNKLRTEDVCGAFQMSRRQLQWWDERKVISPQHVGHARLYSIEQAVLCGIVYDLRKRDLSLQTIRRRLRSIENVVYKTWPSIPEYMLVTDQRVDFSDSPEWICEQLAATRRDSRLVHIRQITRKLYEWRTP